MRPIPVNEIMTVDVISAAPDETAERAAKLMNRHEVGSVMIMKDQISLGILTERDLVRKVMAEGKDPRLIKLESIMTAPLITIDEGMELNEAAEYMEQNNVHKLPVLRNGRVIGLITDHDILKVEPGLIETLQENENVSNPAFLIPNKRGVRGICESCENYSSQLEELNGCWMCPVCKEDMVR